MVGPLFYMKTSIIIPFVQDGPLFRATLASVEASHGISPDAPVHVYLVQNGVAELSSSLSSFSCRFPFTLLHLRQGNKSAALNHALGADEHDFVVFFDDDVSVEGNTLAGFIEAANKYGCGHYFGGPLRGVQDVEDSANSLGGLPQCMEGFDLGKKEFESSEIIHFIGTNWAAFASDIKSAGGFDPMFGPGSPVGASGQESVMMERLYAIGVRPVYLPACVVEHKSRQGKKDQSWILRKARSDGVSLGMRRTGIRFASRSLAKCCYYNFICLITRISKYRKKAIYSRGLLLGIWIRIRGCQRRRGM